ncbi:MAG: DNA polymerase III subunit beta [Bacteroidota bacterium]
MHFTVITSELLKALSTVKKVVPTNPLVPILSNFLFVVKNGKLVITTSDLQTSMVTVLPVQDAKEGKIAVPTRHLVLTLGFLEENEPITFDFDTSNYSLALTSSKGKYKLACRSAEDFPELSLDFDASLSIDIEASLIKKALEQTMFAAGQSESRPELNGVNMMLKNGTIIFSATDGHQLARYKHTRFQLQTTSEKYENHQEESFTIPHKPLQLLVQQLALYKEKEYSMVNMAFDAHSVCFKKGPTHMRMRLADNEFRSYDNIIPTTTDLPKGVLTVDRDVLLKSLKMMAIYANKTHYIVKFKLGAKDTFEVSALDLSFANEAKEVHECAYQGEAFEIGFNTQLLITMFSKMIAKKVIIRLNGPKSNAYIVPKDMEAEEDLLLLLAPMALSTVDF